MTRQPLVSSQTATDEDLGLRPQRMQEMVGQREVMARLQIAVDASAKRGEALGHVLFDGPPGLGKTTFAMCLPREMGVGFQITNGAIIKAPKDLIPFLTNLEENSILFIDEIHRMSKAVEEYLYTAMEDFRIDIVMGEGVNARTLNLPLKPFTLIGATTRTGLLSAPLRDRFQIREHLGFYSVAELTEIVHRSARKLNVPVDDLSAVEIARRSRGTPRIANNLLRWVRDYVTSKADGSISLPLAEAALTMAGIDLLGLDRQDRRYLETLIRAHGGGPEGVESIAASMNTATDTLADEVEPFLLRSELIIRTPRGRMVTVEGYRHMNVPPPAAPGGPQLFE